jgi:hypothetical protein
MIPVIVIVIVSIVAVVLAVQLVRQGRQLKRFAPILDADKELNQLKTDVAKAEQERAELLRQNAAEKEQFDKEVGAARLKWTSERDGLEKEVADRRAVEVAKLEAEIGAGREKWTTELENLVREVTEKRAAEQAQLQSEISAGRAQWAADLGSLSKEVAERRATERSKLESEIKENRSRWVSDYEKMLEELADLTKRVVPLRGIAEMQDYGLYEPIFDFDTSEKYKEAVTRVRDRQKKLIQDEKAAVCDMKWTVEGSEAKGRDMTKRYLKLQLRAFNGECDATITKARFDNVSQLQDRLKKSWEAINLLGKTNAVRITQQYLDLKIEELQLAYELARKKEQEKEEQRAIRAQMKEEEDARKEIEKAQKDAEADESRYAKALDAARKEMESVRDEKQEALRKKIALLEQQFSEAHDRKARAISRAQLTRSGHIYIISNPGSFGEDVFKIGMTRRMEPMERVLELGGASVPFRFDVHAMIYSEDAPTLENALHKKFGSREINRVNLRREFFRVTLDEIAAAVLELCGEEAEFVRTAVAEEFRESEAIRRKEEAERQAQHQVKIDAEVVLAKQRLEELRETWKAEPVA